MKGLSAWLRRFSGAHVSHGAPQSLEDLVNTTADLLEEGSAEQARSLSLEAIRIEPACVEAWSNLAFAEIQLSNLEAAVEAARKALSLDPSHATAWHNLGEAYVRLRKGQEALECNNRALTLDPGRAVFWLGKGEALMALDRCPEAAACFERALAINPVLKSAELNREMALLKANPSRWRLLLIALGLASRYLEREIDDNGLAAKVTAGFYKDPDYDEALVRSFDVFSQINLPAGDPLIVAFSQINLLLATGLRSPELIQRCSERWTEAKLKLRSR